MIAEAVYLLCMLTSFICMILLARAYARNRVPLLMWSAICFGCFAINNALLFIDLKIATDTDLSPVRGIPAAVGVLLLCYGLVSEAVR